MQRKEIKKTKCLNTRICRACNSFRKPNSVCKCLPVKTNTLQSLDKKLIKFFVDKNCIYIGDFSWKIRNKNVFISLFYDTYKDYYIGVKPEYRKNFSGKTILVKYSILNIRNVDHLVIKSILVEEEYLISCASIHKNVKGKNFITGGLQKPQSNVKIFTNLVLVEGKFYKKL